MAKSFYVVCTEFREYSSKEECSSISHGEPVFGSSDRSEIFDCVFKHNQECLDFLNSDWIFFPANLCFYKYFEITNLD